MEELNKVHFERRIFLVRHAEREDEAQSDSEFSTKKMAAQKSKQFHKGHPANCSITSRGEYQSYLTGKAIDQDYMEEKDSKEDEEPLLVLSSPYKRCVQTAIGICKGLETGGRKIFKNTIFVCFQA
jgi:phosphohistidine phosphatase SixA